MERLLLEKYNNVFLYPLKFKSKQTSWRLCGEEEANPFTYFWSCTKITRYWEQVGSAMTKILGYTIPHTCLVMYSGNIKDVVRKEDMFLTKVILTAITKSWLKPDPPKQEDWISIVEKIKWKKKKILD